MTTIIYSDQFKKKNDSVTKGDWIKLIQLHDSIVMAEIVSVTFTFLHEPEISKMEVSNVNNVWFSTFIYIIFFIIFLNVFQDCIQPIGHMQDALLSETAWH